MIALRRAAIVHLQPDSPSTTGAKAEIAILDSPSWPTAATLTALQALSLARDRVHSFDAATVHLSIIDGAQRLAIYPVPKPERPKSSPWEIRPEDFVGVDNSLALATVRMELERELRKSAISTEIEVPRSVFQLLGELVQRRVLPPEWEQAANELISICLEGVHGKRVANNTVLAVIQVAELVLLELHVLRRHGHRSNID